MYSIVILIGAIFTLFGCASKTAIPYNFDQPSITLKLDKELNEISGLQFTSDSTVKCVQDEKANIYEVDSRTGKIKTIFDFGQNADFEGIAIHNDVTYILRSDGTMYISERSKKAVKYAFNLGKGFEFEGLCYDDKHDRLLVACKNHGSKKKNDHIYIFEFSTLTNSYAKEALWVIDKGQIHPNFKASGIGIHPNGNIYVLSSFSKTLLMLNEQGKILDMTQLNSYIYHQPEGICFDSKGTLIIANEKHKTYPTLIKLEIVKNK